MAMFSAFIVYVLSVEQGCPSARDRHLDGVLSGVFGAIVERVLIRPLERRNPLAVVIVTLGLFLVVSWLAQRIWLGTPRSSTAPFPDSAKAHQRSATPRCRHANDLVLGGVATARRLCSGLMLKRTKVGLAFRAVASNRESAQLVGIGVGRTLMLGWALAASLGAFAGSSRPPAHARCSTPTSCCRCSSTRSRR